MKDSIIILLLIQIILIALNAVFASAEIAVLSVNETKIGKLAEDGNKKAKRLNKLIKEPAGFLSTIQIAITLSGFLGSAFAAEGFSAPLVAWAKSIGIGLSEKTLETVAVIVITLILSYFTLIFGELVPKRIAMKKSESLALSISGLLSGISVLFKPVVWLLSVSTNAVLRLLGIDPADEKEHIGEEEIRMMVEAGSDSGTIDSDEREFIHNVFEFDDLTARQIATHRTELAVLYLREDDGTWEERIKNSRHTYYPVCGDTIDTIVGILNAKDYFCLDDRSRDTVMHTAVRKAYFVPETVKADVLFSNMKKQRQPMAVALDEYGGVTGVVTAHDLVERLVGEIDLDAETVGEK